MKRLQGTSQKRCKICGKDKATVDFAKDARFKGGRFPVCKTCEGKR